MGKMSWIIIPVVLVAVVVTALVLMLVLVPQTKSTGTQANKYESIAREEYVFTGKTLEKLKQEYTVTESDVNYGIKKDKYEEGNINPFTPKKDVTIYNEPTLNNNKGNGSNLTPGDK